MPKLSKFQDKNQTTIRQIQVNSNKKRAKFRWVLS